MYYCSSPKCISCILNSKKCFRIINLNPRGFTTSVCWTRGSTNCMQYCRRTTWLTPYGPCMKLQRESGNNDFNNAQIFIIILFSCLTSSVILLWKFLYSIFSARQHICYSALFANARPSVCPSVCLSVTRVDQSKTVRDRITQSSPQCSAMTLVSSRGTAPWNSNGNI